METIRRITVEETRAALELVGGRLERATTWESARRCGCPIGVIAAASGVYENKPIWQVGLYGSQKAIGLDNSYATGFINGFDGYECEPYWSENTKLGHSDGQAVAAALLPPDKSDSR